MKQLVDRIILSELTELLQKSNDKKLTVTDIERLKLLVEVANTFSDTTSSSIDMEGLTDAEIIEHLTNQTTD